MARRPTQSDGDVPSSWLLVGAVVAVALAACVAGMSNELAQDDIYLIQDNGIVHSLANVVAIFRSPFWKSETLPTTTLMRSPARRRTGRAGPARRLSADVTRRYFNHPSGHKWPAGQRARPHLVAPPG